MRLIPNGIQRPERLYKYGGPGALEILRTRLIYLTRPAQFNDPFDTKPHFATTLWLRPTPTSGVSVFPNMQVASAESLLRIKNTVILSLTPHPDSLLMWAHYAAAHTGIAIGFDGRSDILAGGSPHRAAGPVVYSQQRPSAPTHDDLTDTDVLLTKGLDWSYEDEWRIIDSLFSADVDEPDETGDRWAFHLQPDAVKEVILGCRCDGRLEREAPEILREADYEHVKLYTACPSDREYRMELEEWPRSEWPGADR